MNSVLKKLFAVTAVCAAGAAGAFETPPQIFRPGSVVLFQGDSVTHGGRMGDMNHFMGHGYQAEIAMRYLAYRPDDNLQFGNRGESGHTSSNLVARWHRDAFPYEAREAGYRGAFDVTETKLTPDYLSILIGINDYLRTDGWHVSAEDYERNLRYMVTNSLALNPNLRIVLCEPFRLPAEKEGAPLARRQATVRRLAAEYKRAFVPFQRLFSDELMAIRPEPKYWFWDSAHPTYAAHMKMSDFWIRAVSEQTAK